MAARRKTAAERRWRARLTELARSGLSQRDYARRERLSPGTLSWWKWEIARRDGKRSGKKGEGDPKEPAFVPVRVVGGPPPSAAPPQAGFEVRLPNARTLFVPASFDAEALRVLLAVLEEEC